MDEQFYTRCQDVLLLDPPMMTKAGLQNAVALAQTLLRQTLQEVDRLQEEADGLHERNQLLAQQLAKSAQYLEKVVTQREKDGLRSVGSADADSMLVLVSCCFKPSSRNLDCGNLV